LRHRCEYFPEPLAKTCLPSYDESNPNGSFSKEELNISVKEEISDDPCDTSNIQYDSNQFHPNYESAVGFSALQLQTLANYGVQKLDEHGNDLLSKEEVEMRFKNGDPELTFERPTNSRHSDTWHRFEIVYYRGIRQNFAKCMECNSFVSYKKTTGTASLIRHKCRNQKAMEVVPDSLVDLLRQKVTRTATPTSITITSSQPTMTQATERKSQQKFLSETIFSTLIEKQIKFMSKGLYSTNILDDPNFLALAQNLLEIGAHYGNQNVDYLLNKKTVCEDVIPRLVDATQHRLRETLKNLDFTISFKQWEDSEGNQHLTIFAYFLDEDFAYKNVVLATKLVMDEPLSSLVLQVCKDEYSFSGRKLKCISNIPNCDDNFETFFCMVSVFSGIICDCFQSYGGYFKVIYDAVVERIGGGKLFENASPDEIMRAFYRFSQVLKESPEKSEKSLDSFYRYFGTIFSAISSIQNSQKITISEIFLWFRRFLNIYSENSNGYPEIPESLRKEVVEAVKTKQSLLKDFHRIAVFLDPNFKNLKFLEQDERAKLLDTIKQQLKEVIGESPAPSNKRIKLDSESTNETFLEFMDISMENDEDLATAEIQRYMGFKLENPTNLTEFWRTTDNFPHLKILARNLLNVPSCSFHNSCCFLSCDSPIYTRSRNLQPDEIESLTFLHQNL
jgi:hypothetical protein